MTDESKTAEPTIPEALPHETGAQHESRVREALGTEQGASLELKERMAAKDSTPDASADAGGETPTEPTPTETQKGKLPEDFPGREKLEAAGITSYGKLRDYEGELTEIDGIGPATAEKIQAALDDEIPF